MSVKVRNVCFCPIKTLKLLDISRLQIIFLFPDYFHVQLTGYIQMAIQEHYASDSDVIVPHSAPSSVADGKQPN